MRDSLRHLRESIDVPPIDPAREQALLAAFDARANAPRRARWTGRSWTAAAAAVTLSTAALAWIAATARPVAPSIAPPAVTAETAGFVPWPGAQALPPFESGEVRRVDLPVAVLPSLGLPNPASPAAVVKADVIIGRDGFARAVRLVQPEGEQR